MLLYCHIICAGNSIFVCSPVLVDSTAIRKNPARAHPLAGDDRLAGAPAGLLPGGAGPQSVGHSLLIGGVGQQPANYVACHRGVGLCGRVHQFGGHCIHRGIAGTLRLARLGVLDGGGAQPAAILADGGAQHLAQPVDAGWAAETALARGAFIAADDHHQRATPDRGDCAGGGGACLQSRAEPGAAAARGFPGLRVVVIGAVALTLGFFLVF